MADQEPQAVLYWTLRGRLSPDNRFSCRPGILTPHPPRDGLGNTSGELRIEMLDDKGQVLVQQPASTGRYSPDHPRVTRDVSVRAKVPFHPATRAIRLWNGEVLLREWQRPEASPKLDHLKVRREQGHVRLSWKAHHPDDEPMQYVVRFSSDSGRTFNRLSPRLERTEYSVAEKQLPGGRGWIFQVGATDGVNTSTLDSAPIDLPQTPPKVEIASPPDGASVTQGESLLFSGDLVAFIGQRIAVKSVAWTSDRDGNLADRFSFETIQLSRGSHRITLEVICEPGGRLTAAITVDVK